jgi:hypothetical protein
MSIKLVIKNQDAGNGHPEMLQALGISPLQSDKGKRTNSTTEQHPPFSLSTGTATWLHGSGIH